MFCKAIALKGILKIKEELLHAEMAEIRIELCDLSNDELKVIFSSHNNLVATCRPEGINDVQRLKKLKIAIESGATYVDIEIESDKNFIKELSTFAKHNDCTVIISYHNYKITPSQEELNQIVQDCIALGADLVKLACMVNKVQDNARLLALYDTNKPMLVLGMGELGIITRVAATKMGAPFTFVSGENIEETAPGQIKESVMKNILSYL